VVVVACIPASQLPSSRATLNELVWPAPPSAERIAFVMSFSEPEDLGIRKRVWQRLGALFSGAREERLARPVAVVEATGNRLFVADPGVRGVHMYDIEAGDYRLIRGAGDEPLPSPVGLAAGLSGEVYVTDSRQAKLYVIEPWSNEAQEVPLEAVVSQPTGIALDPPSGRIYMVDTGSHEVKIFARDGALLRRIGRRGTGPGQFNFPTMAWMSDKGELLVADSLNFRTQVFDTEGNFIREFGTAGNRAGYQPQPKGVATDSHGHVYIVDSMLHAVQIFDRTGTFLYRLGLLGEGSGEFWLPMGVFVGQRDTIYVADSYNRRVQVFRYIGSEQT
jgi:sugar lactone lactonase YvrE